MGKAIKLKNTKTGDMLYPVTGSDLVFDPTTKKSVKSELSEKVEEAPKDGKPYVRVDGNWAYAKLEALDLSMYDIYGKAIQQTTANCYVVSRAGMYKFPLVFGNGIKNGSANAAAYTKNDGEYSMDFVDYNGTVITSPYIEDVSGEAASVQLSIADVGGVIADLSLVEGANCKYVQFRVTNVPKTGGNVILSVKDAEGVIMWSWHIWLWADDLTPVTITNATGVDYDILPVNLASTWDVDSSEPTKIKNWFYQWGRPTPFIGPEAYNSNVEAISYGALYCIVAEQAESFQEGIRNPATTYKSGNNLSDEGGIDQRYNWFVSEQKEGYYNLWDAALTAIGYSDNVVIKTVYDPCPVDFCMRNARTFTGFDTKNVPNCIGGFMNGYLFKRNEDDTLGVFFPASGHRMFRKDDYLLGEVGAVGKVWSSAVGGLSRVVLKIKEEEVRGIYFPLGYEAYSVRPVREQ